MRCTSIQRMRFPSLPVALLVAGCGCRPGDLDPLIVFSSGPGAATLSGPTTIESGKGTVVFKTIPLDVYASVDDLPADLFPDGANVYAIVTERHKPARGGGTYISTEVSTYVLEGTSKGEFLAAAWYGFGLPPIEGVTFETSTHCTSGADCGDHHFVDVQATLSDGRSLTAAPGEAVAAAGLRLGNGHSFIPEGSCTEAVPQLGGYLAVAR